MSDCEKVELDQANKYLPYKPIFDRIINRETKISFCALLINKKYIG